MTVVDEYLHRLGYPALLPHTYFTYCIGAFVAEFESPSAPQLDQTRFLKIQEQKGIFVFLVAIATISINRSESYVEVAS
ncbi:hypothetical protein QYF36_023262 [Acer negundo]|nr:hypothetical protein QYF36_023262 [Acer negundo]